MTADDGKNEKEPRAHEAAPRPAGETDDDGSAFDTSELQSALLEDEDWFTELLGRC